MANGGRGDRRGRAFEPLPVGTIYPRGWLRWQVRTRANELTGHLDGIWEDPDDDQWLCGRHGGWERGPYDADGPVPLAYRPEDGDVVVGAARWAKAFVGSRDESGRIGPDERPSAPMWGVSENGRP